MTNPKMEKSHPCTRRSNRGAWTALEDKLLRDYVKTHGPGKWRNVSQETGKRDGLWIVYFSIHENHFCY